MYMQIQSVNRNHHQKNFSSIYTNKTFKKCMEIVSDNGALCMASACLGLSFIAKPFVIMNTPKTEKENNQKICAKSILSSTIGYLFMLAVALPVSKSIKKIDANPDKYLSQNTIKNLTTQGKALKDSEGYVFSKQLFTLGLGAVIAAPKAFLTSSLIKPVIDKFIPTEDKKENKNNINFKSAKKINSLTDLIAKIINSDKLHKLSDKFKNSNYDMYMINAADLISATTFALMTSQKKDIDKDTKKLLINNAFISTGLCIGGGYLINKAIEPQTDKFIENFRMYNTNSAKLQKYVDGIKICKNLAIIGSLYYIVIPAISTFLSDKTVHKK